MDLLSRRWILKREIDIDDYDDHDDVMISAVRESMQGTLNPNMQHRGSMNCRESRDSHKTFLSILTLFSFGSPVF